MAMKKNKGDHMNALDPSRKQRLEDVCARIERLGLTENPARCGYGSSRAVIVNGVRYRSAGEAARTLKCSTATISMACNGQKNSKRFPAQWA